MATLRVHDSTEYWKKIDLMVKPASYPMAAGYDVPSVETIHRPLTLDLSEVCHEDRVYWAVRRAQDILLSSLALVVLSPLLLVTYAAIWIDSPDANPIFTQQRVGRNGKLFKMYKFRSMYMDAEERKKELMAQNTMSDSKMFKMDFDPRVIGNKILSDGTKKKGIGQYIRDFSIDEFPQFFNVLKGDLSLVGTRPPLISEVEQYEMHHKSRLATKPGITGMWQVSGRSDITDFEEVVRLDTEYIENWSFGLDILILLKTAFGGMINDEQGMIRKKGSTIETDDTFMTQCTTGYLLSHPLVSSV